MWLLLWSKKTLWSKIMNVKRNFFALKMAAKKRLIITCLIAAESIMSVILMYWSSSSAVFWSRERKSNFRRIWNAGKTRKFRKKASFLFCLEEKTKSFRFSTTVDCCWNFPLLKQEVELIQSFSHLASDFYTFFNSLLLSLNNLYNVQLNT